MTEQYVSLPLEVVRELMYHAAQTKNGKGVVSKVRNSCNAQTRQAVRVAQELPKQANEFKGLECNPSNRLEAHCVRSLQEQGWSVINRGWPDLMAIKGQDQVRLIEVKPAADKLSIYQLSLAAVLKHRLGISVEVMVPQLMTSP